MTNKTDVASTPKYVLRSEGQPFHSKIESGDPKMSCAFIYGFSDKAIYDKFIKNAKQPLTPYPLVQGYLASQIAEANSADTGEVSGRLVVIDATDPTQTIVFAATMAAVLAAQQEKAKQVSIELELTFNPETGGYLK